MVYMRHKWALLNLDLTHKISYCVYANNPEPEGKRKKERKSEHFSLKHADKGYVTWTE